jgi:hypothetical protein
MIDGVMAPDPRRRWEQWASALLSRPKKSTGEIKCFYRYIIL